MFVTVCMYIYMYICIEGVSGDIKSNMNPTSEKAIAFEFAWEAKCGPRMLDELVYRARELMPKPQSQRRPSLPLSPKTLNPKS